jgi:putative membrane protein insertion efficiency factor
MEVFFIKLVRFYQKIAPKEVRDSCRFIPTCSEYMILSIEKHGVLKGISRGIERLLRCKVPNGGIDYP